MRYCLPLLIFFTVGTAFAQSRPDTLWIRTLPDAVLASDILPTDSGYIVTGYAYTQPPKQEGGVTQRCLALITDQGKIQWKARCEPFKAEPDSTLPAPCGLDVGQITRSAGTKLLTAWNTRWEFEADAALTGQGSDTVRQGFFIERASDGGWFIAGTEHSLLKDIPNDRRDLFLLKTNEKGDAEWVRTFPGGFAGHLALLRSTPGGVFLAAEVSPMDIAARLDLFLARVTDSGLVQWTWRQHLLDGNRIGALAPTADGGCLIAIHPLGLARLGGHGEMLWTETYTKPRETWPNALTPLRDGGWLITGTLATPTAPREQMLVLRTDDTGRELWHRTFGGAPGSEGMTALQTADGAYLIAGSLSRKFAVVKLAPDSGHP